MKDKHAVNPEALDHDLDAVAMRGYFGASEGVCATRSGCGGEK